jgi:tRNA(Ile)-lysidine synthase
MPFANLPKQSEAIVSDISQMLRSLKSSPIYIGYSGGVDSTLLLTIACDVLGADNVVAIHVNHQLSDVSEQGMKHTQQACLTLGCRFEARNVDVENMGCGLEAEARQQRYSVFSDILESGTTLLLGHHLDDQVETFFLRMFRGAGKHGLKGMSQNSVRDHYNIFRPLLDVSREQIEKIAHELNLNWIEDDSNQDERFDRNFLRQTVLPAIEGRWPSYRDKVIQTMSLFVEEEKGEANSEFDVANELEHRLSHDMGLKLVQIEQFTQNQLMSLLHLWLVKLGLQVPSRARLQAVVDSVINAQSDAQPEVELAGGFIRRHGPALYWVGIQQPIGKAPSAQLNQPQDWPGVGLVDLVDDDHEPRLSMTLPDLHWSTRQGGEVMRPVGRSKRRDLKRLFQEYRFKPWLRDRTPLLFSGKELVAIGDSLLSAEHIALPGEPGFRVIWQNGQNAD